MTHPTDIPPSVRRFLATLERDAPTAPTASSDAPTANHLHRSHLLLFEELRQAYQSRRWIDAWRLDEVACARLEYVCAVGGAIEAVRFDALRRLCRLTPSTNLFLELLATENAPSQKPTL